MPIVVTIPTTVKELGNLYMRIAEARLAGNQERLEAIYAEAGFTHEQLELVEWANANEALLADLDRTFLLAPTNVSTSGSYRDSWSLPASMFFRAPKDREPQPLRPCPLGVGAAATFAGNMTMTDWVRILGLRPQLNRTVVDRTGLTGGFDITLTYPQPDDPGAATLLPAIKPLLEPQHGLTLRDADAPVEILVIEHIDRPTDD